MRTDDDLRAEFTDGEIGRSRRYHRPGYVAAGVDAAVGVAVLAALAFGAPGNAVFGWFERLPWWGSGPLFAAATVVLLTVAGLPVGIWRYRRERRWGFSTQPPGGWVRDLAKGLAIGVVLGSAVLTGYLWLVRTLPSWWPVAGAVAAALVVLLLTFVAPVVLEPIFNRFEPMPDRDLANRLRALAERAGVPVASVLVADASRRTRKQNAYVSGLGATRRVVVFDTLLTEDSGDGVPVIVAHELGHRRLRHVARATALGMAGAAGFVVALWAVLRSGAVLAAAGATGPGDPRVIPFVVFAATVFEFLMLAPQSALSRRWESAADRFAVDLTGDAGAFAVAFRDLAVRNVLDLDPPPPVYLLLFSHPTAPQRIAAARRRGETSDA
ncbi:MAG TPA: M48 family metallopeptidase [Actinomycetota bacterium]|jgi:STE24 endopeptidase